MKVTPLQGKSEIAAAFNWRTTDGIWLHFNASNIENRYWCCYGVQDPTREDNLE